jgi:ribosomal-protein-alanine N-acetyltransferase
MAAKSTKPVAEFIAKACRGSAAGPTSVSIAAASHFRWMIRRDMPAVLDIERRAFCEMAWPEEDFIRCLRQRNCIGMVAELGERVVGYELHELHKDRIHLINLAVHPDFCQQGIGRQLVQKLVDKLNNSNRRRVVAEVRERNLPAQLFFRAIGFRAVNTLRNFYAAAGIDEDAYQFRKLAPRKPVQQFTDCAGK